MNVRYIQRRGSAHSKHVTLIQGAVAYLWIVLQDFDLLTHVRDSNREISGHWTTTSD